jgi:hypothetical protein
MGEGCGSRVTCEHDTIKNIDFRTPTQWRSRIRDYFEGMNTSAVTWTICDGTGRPPAVLQERVGGCGAVRVKATTGLSRDPFGGQLMMDTLEMFCYVPCSPEKRVFQFFPLPGPITVRLSWKLRLSIRTSFSWPLVASRHLDLVGLAS